MLEKLRRGSSCCGLGGSCGTPVPFRHLTNAERAGRQRARLQTCRHTPRYCTGPRGRCFTITTIWGREVGGPRGTENHFLCCQVHLAQLAVISLATGLAAGHWPIKSTQGQRAIGVFDQKTKEGEGWSRAEGGRCNGKKSWRKWKD